MIEDCAVIVPAFNEGIRIAKVLDELKMNFRHIICIDDCSTDLTRTEIAKYPNVYLLEHCLNAGQGSAINTGLMFANRLLECNFVATFDADGQHNVQDLLYAYDLLKRENFDIVLGTRFKSEMHIPLVRKLMLLMLTRLSKVPRRLGLTDVHNGLRVFKKQHFRNVRLSSGMSHADDFLEIIYENNLRYAEHQNRVLYEIAGKKSQTLWNGVNILSERWFI